VQQLRPRGMENSKSTQEHARVSRRYPLRELVIFSCWGNHVTVERGTGFTENVSTTGIAFVTESAVAVGSSINLNLHLRSVTDEGRTILLHAEGTVLRVEPSETRSKIAAEIRFQDDLEEDFAVSTKIQ